MVLKLVNGKDASVRVQPSAAGKEDAAISLASRINATQRITGDSKSKSNDAVIRSKMRLMTRLPKLLL